MYISDIGEIRSSLSNKNQEIFEAHLFPLMI